MPIDYSKLRSMTAREMGRELLTGGSTSSVGARATRAISTRMGAASPSRTTARAGTFVPKTLRSMIEEQARWTEGDLRRLKLLK